MVRHSKFLSVAEVDSVSFRSCGSAFVLKLVRREMDREETVCLSGIKPILPPQTSCSDLDGGQINKITTFEAYPFATVLRLRVLQIVCGITFLIMGTVGFIEERGELNLGFGIPAGSAIILAAAGSLHTTKGFGGYKTSTCPPNSPLRFLGPTLQIAVPLTIIWGTACSFLVALFVKSLKTLTINPIMKPNYDDEEPNYLCHKRDLTILASLEASLCFVVIISIITLLRIDCKYDPD